MMPTTSVAGEVTAPLANLSLLLLLVLTHQNSRGYNPFRLALSSFQDEHGSKVEGTFSVNLERLYLCLCKWALFMGRGGKFLGSLPYVCTKNETLVQVHVATLTIEGELPEYEIIFSI